MSCRRMKTALLSEAEVGQSWGVGSGTCCFEMRHLRGEAEGAREIIEPRLLKTILKFKLLTSAYGGRNVWPAGQAGGSPALPPASHTVHQPHNHGSRTVCVPALARNFLFVCTSHGSSPQSCQIKFHLWLMGRSAETWPRCWKEI